MKKNILLTVVKELAIIRLPNLWTLSAENFPNQATPQTPGAGVAQNVPPRKTKLKARMHSTHSLLGSTLLIGGVLSITTY